MQRASTSRPVSVPEAHDRAPDKFSYRSQVIDNIALFQETRTATGDAVLAGNQNRLRASPAHTDCITDMAICDVWGSRSGGSGGSGSGSSSSSAAQGQGGSGQGGTDDSRVLITCGRDGVIKAWR